jgi:hypothetical protein
VGGVDSALVSLDKRNPGSGLKAYKTLLHDSGLSASQFANQLPKATKSIPDVARPTSLLRMQKLSTDFTHGASKAVLLSGALRKAGISTSDYHKELSTLPAFVKTQVTTPGAVTSRKQVLALGHQFGLTPKQVKTLMLLAGVNKAITDAARARAALLSIPRDIVTHVSVQRSAKLPSLNKPRVGAPGTAVGGVFSGQRGIGVIRRIAEAGAEAVVPLNRALSQVDPSVRALSAIAQGKVPGMASGGVVGGGSVASSVTLSGPVNLHVDGRDMRAWFEESYDGQMALPS